MAKSQPDEEKDAWEVKQLLEQFSYDIAEKAATVCLAHLFTYQDFDMGTLGLAYVASQKPNSHGGICPKAYSNSIPGKAVYLNSGLTSTKNYGKTILTKEADLVTTHELGHNFGAEHDPDSMPQCAPTEDQGGKYVMYPIAVSGDHENNKMFSNCSKASILQTIQTKAPECFKERTNKVCGNSRVDEGEECDPGLLHLQSDPCCTSDCKLKPGAKCSDRNSPCCKGCEFESADKKCQEAFKEDLKLLRIPEEFIADFATVVFGNRRTLLEAALQKQGNRLLRIEDFKWRVDVAISTSSLARALQPSILMQLKLSDGSAHRFEVPVAKFQELRYNIALILKEMNDLEKRSILKIQD